MELFAFLHDAERWDDGRDPTNGSRSAELVVQINGDLIHLSSCKLGLLQQACEGHSDGHTVTDITVMTCWDAYRLDLGRVGIKPHRKYLCPGPAQRPDILDTAYQRSLRIRYD